MLHIGMTVTDPKPSTRRMCNDALGRLYQVTEDPSGFNYSTTYAYSALDGLLTVAQGSQTRTFSYDSLSRLTSATNPEVSLPNGTPCPISYSYDGNGNLTSRVAPLENQNTSCSSTVTTSYTYDELNRLTGKSYNDNPQTPSVSLAYDESSVTPGSWTSPGLAYPNGRITHTTTMSGSTLQTATVQDYDKMGRTKHYWQCTPLNCGSSSIWAALYNYDSAGDVTWWNHPAGFTINQPVDNARHIEQVTSTWSDGQHPATLASGTCLPNSTSICYTAWGAVSSLQNPCVGSGCPVQETYFYNKRLQTAVAELGTSSSHALDSCREYSYYVGVGASGCSETPSNWPTGTNNSGNVAGYFYQDSMNALGHTATYTYDGVNRLHTAVATGNVAYNQTYTYTGDGSNGQYGNMSCTASPSNPKCLAPTYSAATNHIAGYQYDAAGNVINDGTFGYQWDAEGKLIAITLSGNSIAANMYNALGQNVRHVGSGETTDEAYGADGSLLWRNTGGDSYTRAFVPFQGRILAEYYSGGTLFDRPDEIGSLTIANDYATNHSAERLFYPFGELWTGSDVYNLGMHQTFAQLPDYDNDANSDLYNTLNRHYTPSGRWLSPDPGGVKVVKLDDPQTWNLYAYVRNNPTSLTDPLGLQGNDCAKDMKKCHEDKPLPPTDRTIKGTQAQENEKQKETQSPPNSRQNVVLIPAGKPERYKAFEWRMNWKIREKVGNDLEAPGSKYEKSVVTLIEQVGADKEWKFGGSEKGEFEDTISIESRTIIQRFSVDSQRVQVVLRRDDQGNLVATWDVKVNVTPSGPVYSPAP